MLKLLRLLILILLAPLALSLTYEAYQFIRSGIQFQDIAWFLYGFGSYCLLYAVFLVDRIQFLEVLEHEIAHTAVSLMFLKVPDSLKAARKGGEVGPLRGDFLAYLAPYFLPVLTIPLLIVSLFMPATLDKALDFLIGFSLAFHYGALVYWEFRFHQTDFQKMGMIFSVIVILVFNAVWLVIILSVVTDEYASLLEYFKQSFSRTRALYGELLQAWRARELPSIKDLIEQSNPQ